MILRNFLCVSSALALGACVVGPDYAPPTAAVPAGFAHGNADGRDASGTTVDLARWWESFGDPQLNALVERALADNPTMAIAASRVRQARLQEIVARAEGKPSLGASSNVSRIDFSRNAGFSSLARQFSGGGSGDGGSGGVALPGGGITTYAVGFDASWELDVFGGARRGVQAATATTQAAEWNRRDAAITLVAEVVDAYFALRLDQQQIILAQNELAAHGRLAEIAGHTASVGLTPSVDILRARGDILATKARLDPLRADMDIRLHALALLLARPPESFNEQLTTVSAAQAAVPNVPIGLPSDIVRRRPDIRAAERRLAAATADIGVAVADLYPRFNLTSLVELLSSSLGNIFSSNSLQFVAGGAVQFPVIDWGRGKARVGLRREDREQAYVEYQSVVLGALRDVADSLARIESERRRNSTLKQALDDLEKQLHAAQAQYRAGISAQSPVLAAQIAMFEAEQQLATSDASLRQLTGGLFKAVGGGWSEIEVAR